MISTMNSDWIPFSIDESPMGLTACIPRRALGKPEVWSRSTIRVICTASQILISARIDPCDHFWFLYFGSSDIGLALQISAWALRAIEIVQVSSNAHSVSTQFSLFLFALIRLKIAVSIWKPRSRSDEVHPKRSAAYNRHTTPPVLILNSSLVWNPQNCIPYATLNLSHPSR